MLDPSPTARRAATCLLVALLVAGCDRDRGPRPDEAPEPAGERRPTPPPPPLAERVSVSLEPAPPRREARTPIPVAVDAATEAARGSLERVVRAHALDPDNGWALAHALLALGADARLAGGEPVVDHLFAAFARRDVAGRLGFPEAHGGQRVEAHPELMLKSLTEVGVRPDRAVVVDGEPTRLVELWRGALSRAWLDGPTPSWGFWNDAGWALQGIAAWAPADARWRAAGKDVALDALTNAAYSALREESALLRRIESGGQAPTRRALGRAGKLGIMGFTCGGAHFIQGVAYAFARGFGDPAARATLGQEASIALWRLSWELPELDAFATQFPELRPQLLVQRLKFLGHLLETAHGMAALGLFEPTAQEREALGAAARQLVATVHTLERRGWFRELADLRARSEPVVPEVTTNEQLYLDTVGDASHALHGLDLATGRAVVRY